MKLPEVAALTYGIEGEDQLKAAYYESVGCASDVLQLGDVPTPPTCLWGGADSDAVVRCQPVVLQITGGVA